MFLKQGNGRTYTCCSERPNIQPQVLPAALKGARAAVGMREELLFLRKQKPKPGAIEENV